MVSDRGKPRQQGLGPAESKLDIPRPPENNAFSHPTRAGDEARSPTREITMAVAQLCAAARLGLLALPHEPRLLVCASHPPVVSDLIAVFASKECEC